MENLLAESIVSLKKEFVRTYRGHSHLHEVIPTSSSSNDLPIDGNDLKMMHKFAENNPVYFNSYESEIMGIPCIVYEGDINDYWLNSIKHDTSYAPFYPTWILSAYMLALESKELGYKQVVDIGSGDGRIAYCTQFMGIPSYGIEIDENLIILQEKISSSTGVEFRPIMTDATQFDYSSLGLSKSIFFIGGLPEVGEMLANNVIEKISLISGLKGNVSFVLTGTYSVRRYSKNDSRCGWGNVIDNFGLEVIKTVTLPTRWTVDQPIDTPYVFTSN